MNGGQALAVQAARAAYGRIDILVNSTSPSGVIKPFEQMNWDEFTLSVNRELKAAFMLTKAVLSTKYLAGQKEIY